MAFAIIETGSKQYYVSVGTEIYIEKVPGKENEKIVFDKVLMSDKSIGTPYLKGSTVVGKIIKQGREEKIRIIHHISQKHHTKRSGHRQPYTKIVIEEIKA